MVIKQEPPNEPCKDWYSRGYLPHYDGGSIAQAITFRLADSLPASLMRQWAAEFAHLSLNEADSEISCRVEKYLDSGYGACWLSRPAVAGVVCQALTFFDGKRYCLHAWVIMPNHVHVLLTPATGHSMAQILHSWKSFTAKKANALVGRNGSFWQKEYFDRAIRDAEHFAAMVSYIEDNPVKAGLCQSPHEWPYSSAAVRAMCDSECATAGPSIVLGAD